jgi:hypothetical protein
MEREAPAGGLRFWQRRCELLAESAKSFAAATPRTVIVIPENYQGWNVRLVKHPSC